MIALKTMSRSSIVLLFLLSVFVPNAAKAGTDVLVSDIGAISKSLNTFTRNSDTVKLDNSLVSIEKSLATNRKIIDVLSIQLNTYSKDLSTLWSRLSVTENKQFPARQVLKRYEVQLNYWLTTQKSIEVGSQKCLRNGAKTRTCYINYGSEVLPRELDAQHRLGDVILEIQAWGKRIQGH